MWQPKGFSGPKCQGWGWGGRGALCSGLLWGEGAPGPSRDMGTVGDLWYLLECEDGVISPSWGDGLGLAVAPPADWGGCQGSPALTVPHVAGKGDLQPQLDNALQDVNDMYLLLEETEKQAVRKALIEERGRFCTFITFLQPVVVSLGGWEGQALLLQPSEC